MNSSKNNPCKQEVKYFHVLNLGCKLEFLDILDLHSGIQSLGASFSTVQYGMAAIQLELVIYSIKPLLCVFITTVHYPSAFQQCKQQSVSS